MLSFYDFTSDVAPRYAVDIASSRIAQLLRLSIWYGLKDLMRHRQSAGYEVGKQHPRNYLYKNLIPSSFSFFLRQSSISPDIFQSKDNHLQTILHYHFLFYKRRHPFSAKPLLHHASHHSTCCRRSNGKLRACFRLPSRAVQQDLDLLAHWCRGRHRCATCSHLRHRTRRTARCRCRSWKCQRPQRLRFRSLPLRLQRARMRCRSQCRGPHRYLEPAIHLNDQRRRLHQDRHHCWRSPKAHLAIGVHQQEWLGLFRC